MPTMLRNASDLGSSPRVRGKQRHGRGGRRLLRLIPARAGKTRHQPRTPRGRRAHPRACGENTLWVMVSRFAFGSSPRVRGKLSLVLTAGGDRRLIPARAGKTSSRSCTRGSAAAHPRACGENISATASCCFFVGSSPRVRGKRRGGRGGVGARGLIPARAGKTTSMTRRGPVGPAHPRACGENLSRSSLTFVSWGSSPRVRGKR